MGLELHPLEDQGGQEQEDAAGEYRVDDVVVKNVFHHPAGAEGDDYLRDDNEEIEHAHVRAHFRRRQGSRQHRVGHREDAGPGDAHSGHRRQQEILVLDHQHGHQTHRAAQEAKGMDRFGGYLLGQRDQDKREHQRGAVVPGETQAAPGRALRVGGGGGIRRAEHSAGYGRSEIGPHAKQPGPGEDLDPGQLPHAPGHRADGGEEFGRVLGQTRFLGLHAAERLEVLGRIFFGAQDGHQHGDEEHRRADVKREFDRQRDLARAGRAGGHAKPVDQDPRQGRRDHRAQADQERLHRIPERALRVGKHVRHEGAEGFHGDVDRGVQDPQQAHRHPQHARVGHGQQRQRRKQGAGEEIGFPAAQGVPGAVAQMAHDGLHNEAGERRGNPEDGQFALFGAEVLVDRAHVGHLQAPAELDAHEPETHVPDLPEGKTRFIHARYWVFGIRPQSSSLWGAGQVYFVFGQSFRLADGLGPSQPNRPWIVRNRRPSGRCAG